MSHKLIQPINSKLKNSSTRHTFNILHDNLSWMSFQGPPRSLTLNSNKPVMALEKIEDEIKTGIIECFEYFFETISNFKIRPTIEKMKVQEGI